MRLIAGSVLVLGLIVSPVGASAQAQRMQQREQAFLKEKPRVGEQLPNVTVYSADGTPFNTAGLRGHYTVLTFGCLT